ncbi:MAG TPA: GAF domain-containing protein, partial [Bacteroidota bacterium]|nr:GAF domain-containing protein [Bacteroidota bacterium]
MNKKTYMSSQWITQIDEFRHQFDELRGRSSTDELAWLKVERRLQLQYVVTRVLGESSSLDEVAPKLLQSICVIERWQFGELWVPTSDSSRLRFGDFWHASTFDAAEFIRQAKRMTFQQGQGLPGKVWVEGKPKLISDINSMSDAPRMSQALKLGFRSALASPLSSRNGFSGVMVFYSREPRAPDVDLLDLFDAISRQTRDFLLRYRAEQHLRKNEKRFRALIERSYDATVLLGTDGKILYAAPSVDRVFGYSVDEFVGRTAFEFI